MPHLHAHTFPILFSFLSHFQDTFSCHMVFWAVPIVVLFPNLWYFSQPYWSHSYWSHGTSERTLFSRIPTSCCTLSCPHIDYDLCTSNHWDSHCRRTWTTSTIQSIIIQNHLPTKESQDRTRMEWFPPGIVSKQPRAVRLGLQPPAGSTSLRQARVDFLAVNLTTPDTLHYDPEQGSYQK